MTYSSLGELRDAYASGAVTAPLMLDNDWVGVYQGGEEVYESHSYHLLRDALDLLGIPHKNI